MVVRRILYHPGFVKELKRLSVLERERAVKTEKLFRANPLHPALRLHALKGHLAGIWSISVTYRIRILFKRYDDGDIVFLTVGRHDIYRSY